MRRPTAVHANPALYCAWFASTAVLLISGCASSTPDSATPSLDGPWADTMLAMSAEGDEFVASVLEDGRITDMEYQEALTRVEECYASHNATVTYDRYGFETVTSLDGKSDPLELMSACARADGGIVVLFDQMRRNPDNDSEEELLAGCLARVGVVEPGFTAEDFVEAMTSPAGPPWEESDERVEECNRDPLGTMSGD